MKSNRKEEKLNEDDYLNGELISQTKHEFIDGYIYAMAGASENHNTICTNLTSGLHGSLKQQNSPCKTFVADMKVKIEGLTNNYFYPDVMVVCDKDNNEYFKTSPIIIFEVLSKTTRKEDRTVKMINYFNIASLQEYVLIEQDFCEIQLFKRKEHWKSYYYFLGDIISFESMGISLSVEEIYYQVENEDMFKFREEKK